MSSSAAQLAANRANALHSTGPVTAEGKAVSSRNAFQHGFRSQTVLLPGDDPAEYQALLDQLQSQFPPQDLNGERCLREMADAEWRLRRARAHFQSMLSRKIEELTVSSPGLSAEEIQVLAHEQLAAASPYFRQLPLWEEKFRRQYDRAWQMWTGNQRHSLTARRKAAELPIAEHIFAPPPRATGSAAPKNRTNEAKPPTAPNAAAPAVTVGTPRNAPCPCGSRDKYKRCCGKSAPPVLFAA